MGVALKGMVHGGQQPVVGSHVYLFAAGATGYGSAAVSLLTPGLSGVATDSTGAYVTTDASGGFSITGDWSCVHGTDQVYILATGGNPGLPGVTNNTGIELMAAVGTCSGLTPSTFIFVSEVSTVAAAVSLQQFMTEGSHVGASAANVLGLANAFATVKNMVDLASGLALTTTAGGNGTVPQATLNTLANILATCVNSASNTSAGCSALFSAAKLSGGNAPTNTLAAALLIAQNPANNVAALYALPTANPPFLPALTSAPNDWTIGITYGLGQNTLLQDVEIDANGNVWATSCAAACGFSSPDSVIELSPTGSVLSGTGFTGGGSVHSPFVIAFDTSGGAWVTNNAVGSLPDNVTKLTSSGTLVSGFPIEGPELSGPVGIAIDSSGNAWVANSNNDTIAKFDNSGTLLSGSGYTSSGFVSPAYVAVDVSGSVWITGFLSSSLLKLAANGTVLSGTGSGYTGGGLNIPDGIAVDGSGDIWATNVGAFPSTISKFANAGTPISGSSGYAIGAQGYAQIISIDGAGTAWSATCDANCGQPGPGAVVRIGANGTVLTPPSGYLNAGFDSPFAQAIDSSGNLWVANGVGGSIVELVGVAAPVKTPIVAAVTGNLLGQRP
jgi:sugar lactone lactonase YvrE